MMSKSLTTRMREALIYDRQHYVMHDSPAKKLLTEGADAIDAHVKQVEALARLIADLQDANDRLRTRLADNAAALDGTWQPLNTCPADHVLFHGSTRHQREVVFSGWRGTNGRYYSDGGEIAYPTAWQPIPKGPKS